MDWLEGWLQNPKPIRQMEYNSIEKRTGNHPKLSDKEAHQVTEYLNTLTSKDVAEKVIEDGKPNIQARLHLRRSRAVMDVIRNEGREGCWRLKRLSLVDAGKRLRGDWIYAYLKIQRH